MSSVLKMLAKLLLVYPMHVQLRGDPGTCVGSYRVRRYFYPSLSSLIFPSHSPAFRTHCPVPLARKMFQSAFELQVPPVGYSSICVEGHAQGNAVREKGKKSPRNSFAHGLHLQALISFCSLLVLVYFRVLRKLLFVFCPKSLAVISGKEKLYWVCSILECCKVGFEFKIV